MAFWQKFKKTGSDAHFLCLDIGTDMVKALVCVMEGKKAKVLGFGKKKQRVGDMENGVIVDIASVIANCFAAIKEAEDEANVSTKKVIIGISGELIKGDTSTMSYVRRDANAKIDLSELKNIVHKIQWRAFDLIRNQIAYETGYNEIDMKLINAAIVDTRIDGYRVANPIGFQGKEVSLSVYNSFSPVVYFGALQTIAAEIEREILCIASEPYALAKCIGGEDGNQLNAIFIDVGAGMTNVSVVSNGVIAGTKMFTIGGNTFTKRISRSLNISFKDADEIKISYSNDKLERQSSKIVRESIKSDLDIWLSGVVLALSDLTKIEVLPSKIFLSGGCAHLPEIKEALETREWVKSMSFIKKPQISFLNPKLISNVIDDSKVLKDIQDIMPLALANLALSYIGEESLATKVLKKVVRLMQI